MRTRIAFAALLLALAGALPAIVGSPRPPIPQDPAPAANALRQIPGTRVKLRIPAGFAPRPGFPGYAAADGRGVLAAVEGLWPKGTAPADLGEATERERFEVLERAELKISGHPALLLRVQDRPVVPGQLRWLLRSGADARFIRVHATLMSSGTDDAAREIVAILRSAEWDLDAPVDVSETLEAALTPPPGMVCTYCFEARAKYTSVFHADGETDPKAAEWEVVQVPTETKPSQLEAECRARLWQTMSSSNAEESVSRAVEVSGSSGWEIEARLKSGRRGVTVWHQLVLLRDSRQLVVFVGHVPEADSKTWLPRFREATRSWKPRPATPPPAPVK